MSHQRQAIVIGGGFGGLAAAIRLQSLGFATTLLEKNPAVGGRAGQIQEQGYTFDTGPSLVTAPAILDNLFQATGSALDKQLPLVPLDPYYRVYFHDKTFIDYTGDSEAMKRQMAQFNEKDAQAYDRFMRDAEPVFHAVITDQLGATPFDKISTMLRFAPKAIKLKVFLPLYFNVCRYFKDFRHRFLYSFHPLFIGGNPFSTPSIYLMIPYLEKKQGVWFAPRGMYSLVEAYAQAFARMGGTILCSHEVTRMHIEGRRIQSVEANGKCFRADLVVSNADVCHTYKDLTPSKLRRRWTNKKLQKLDYTMSCFMLYLGVKRQYPELKHHTLILSRRYRELIHDIFKRKILPDDFSMYLHAPTKSDPSLAPEGCESLYVLIPVANNQSGIDWESMKQPFADKVVSFLEEWGLKDLREHIEVRRIATPHTFASQHNSAYGNAFGITPSLLQTGFLRPHNRSEEFKNLYLVGAGTHPGAGLPGVLLSAEAMEKCVRSDYPELGN